MHIDTDRERSIKVFQLKNMFSKRILLRLVVNLRGVCGDFIKIIHMFCINKNGEERKSIHYTR